MKLSILNENTLILNIGAEIALEHYYHLKDLSDQLMEAFEDILYCRFAYVDLMIQVKDMTIKDAIEVWLKTYRPQVKYPETIEVLEIPVCYDPKFALDQAEVMAHTGLSWAEIVKRHSDPLYFVHFLGFTYGFGYLGGLDPTIAVPRRSSPRLKIQPGSVGLAGGQTGIYPSALPGGWQLIGRTPLALYDDKDTLLKPGMFLRFTSIDLDAYDTFDGALNREVIPWPLR